MRIGVDTNVLVQAHVASLPSHSEARAFLLEALTSAGTVLVISPLVLHELVHVITDARRFDPPVAMGEALAIAHGYLGRSNVECVASDAEAMSLALDLIGRHRLGRRRVADTLFAATLLRHGVMRLATFNVDDFRVFEGLEPYRPGSDRDG